MNKIYILIVLYITSCVGQLNAKQDEPPEFQIQRIIFNWTNTGVNSFTVKVENAGSHILNKKKNHLLFSSEIFKNLNDPIIIQLIPDNHYLNEKLEVNKEILAKGTYTYAFTFERKKINLIVNIVDIEAEDDQCLDVVGNITIRSDNKLHDAQINNGIATKDIELPLNDTLSISYCCDDQGSPFPYKNYPTKNYLSDNSNTKTIKYPIHIKSHIKPIEVTKDTIKVIPIFEPKTLPPEPVTPRQNIAFYYSTEYFHRTPKYSLVQDVRRPKSNFRSYTQFNGILNLENLINERLHLQIKLSVLTLVGIGVGVSVSPVITFWNGNNSSCNIFSAVAITSHGVALKDRSNGFSEGEFGLQLGFGDRKSHIQNGKITLKFAAGFKHIPYINNLDLHNMKKLTYYKLGAEYVLGSNILNLITIDSIAFQYNYNDNFKSNFIITLQYY